jgi:hypothetical protein
MHIVDAPLGLANVLTVLCALVCLWTVLPEKRGGVIQARLLALSAGLAGVVALVLLAGVFDATLARDAEWTAALVLGAVIGRARGWSLPFEIALPGGIAGLRARWDGVFVAAGIAAAAFVDFAIAALEQPVVHPIHIAAVAAFCAGFLGSRALAILVRLERRTH